MRQQYRDFLNREADPAGLAFWTGEINNCTPKPQCTDLKRINVSAAFFLSIEFQTTGNLVRNFYVAALDRPATNNMPAFEEFERDTQAMQRGVIVDPNNNAWETVLNNNRDAFHEGLCHAYGVYRVVSDDRHADPVCGQALSACGHHTDGQTSGILPSRSSATRQQRPMPERVAGHCSV